MQNELETTLRKFAPRLEPHVQHFGDRMPAIFWSTDSQLRVTSAQGTGLIWLGLTPEEVKGLSLFDYLRRPDPDVRLIAAHQEALQGKSSSFAVTWTGRTFDIHLEPQRDAEGNISGTIGVALELTERLRERSPGSADDQRLRALLENSGELQALLGADGTLGYVSPSTTRILGYPADELVGRSAFEFVHPEDREHTRKIFSAPLRGRGDGSIAPDVEASLSTLRGGAERQL